MPFSVLAKPALKESYPRLLNHYLSWVVSPSEADELSRWDIVVLDMEVSQHNPDSIRRIREKNPNIVILAYVTPAEIRTDLINLGNAAPLRNKISSRIHDEWYVKDAHGERRSFWPGTTIVNITDVAPVVNGVRWNDTMAAFVRDEILSSGLWDGIMLDNAWENISYFAHGPVDLDGDGVNETPERADELWRAGLRSLFKKTRAAVPNAYVFANDGPLYANEVDGMLVENFAKDPFSAMVRKLTRVHDATRLHASMLNANTVNTGQAQNYQAMRYGLSTAFAYDSFYSFDSGDQTHAERWWYDEYGVFLGAPRGAPQTLANGVIRRDFDQGTVLVNPTTGSRAVRFVEDVEKLAGVQDKTVNDGSIVSQLVVPGTDGILLRRRLSEIPGAVYENGAFVRVFGSDGKKERAGFFSQGSRMADGAMTAVVDLDGDGVTERVSAIGPLLSVDGHTIRPFGQNFKGSMSLAIGNIDGDGRQEIIVGSATTGTGEVRIYRSDLSLSRLPWRAFGSRYQGGVNLAAADFDGNGTAEIIVGAGPGSAPEVRIFSSEGKLFAPGFFAFDPRFKGGVKVAAGTIMPGKGVQVAVGPGIGGGPQIRIFNSRGQALTAGFFAFDRSRRSGVTPVIADLDGDGTNELLALTRDLAAP